MASFTKRLLPSLNRPVTGLSVMALWLFVAFLLVGSTTAMVSADQGYSGQLDQSLVASHTSSSRTRFVAPAEDTDAAADMDPPDWLVLATAVFCACQSLSALPVAPASLGWSADTAFIWPPLRAPPLA